MNIQQLFDDTLIEKQKRYIQAEFTSVEIIDSESVLTLKLVFTDLTEERMLKILESVKDFLR